MLEGLSQFETTAIWGVFAIAWLGLFYGWYLVKEVRSAEMGDEKMVKVWSAIRDGANAYLGKQLKAILPLIGVLTLVLFGSVYVVPPTAEAMERFKNYDEQTVKLIIGIGRAVAFVMGSGFSLLVGQLGMRMAVQGNIRAAQAARSSFGGALKVAYRAGTITGMLTDGLGLLGGTVIFMIFGIAAPDALLGFGFGGTLLALFMRVGGGIYTKAADVGADLVGKVEQDIPEDDPRNPAVIADLVGDNVGDCAGMAADIFESYEVTIVSGLILGLALHSITGHMHWIIYPLIVRGIGVLSSILGTYAVKDVSSKPGDAMAGIFKGFITSAIISVVLFGIAGFIYLNDPNGDGSQLPGGWWRTPLAVAVGVLLAVCIDRLTEYFTGTHGAPVKSIRKASDTGPATLILNGLSVGYESAVWTTLVIALTIAASIGIFGGIDVSSFVDPSKGLSAEWVRFTFILYGVAMTGIGMLTLTGNNVAMDSFGPIADNANGVAEMAWHGMEDEATVKARQIMADLDGVGNTTKAITKGVAIGSAVIAAVSLFGSFIVDVSNAQIASGLSMESPELFRNVGIRVHMPVVFVGMLIGGMLPWLFSSFAIQAVARAAQTIIEECRRQFRLGVLEGKVEPDYSQCVGISTQAAQKELIPLATLGVVSPVLIGLLMGVEALGGFLAGIIISGQLLAVFMNNAGGAWDNAKKIVEDEPKDPANNLGKGSERHKATVVGDTVGDPLKDTAGPALNPMIKVCNLVAVIAAPVIVQYPDKSNPMVIGAIVLMFGALIWAVRTSKKTPPELSA
ncbi:MAG: sodium-translocating pyrophosphatase [Armatimonadetes bacterium]|nr:sodium-translocating pyrophosphatase [Armatimonadota bacterium]